MHAYLAIIGIVIAAMHPAATGHLVAAVFALAVVMTGCATVVLVARARADYRVVPAYAVPAVQYAWKDLP